MSRKSWDLRIRDVLIDGFSFCPSEFGYANFHRQRIGRIVGKVGPRIYAEKREIFEGRTNQKKQHGFIGFITVYQFDLKAMAKLRLLKLKLKQPEQPMKEMLDISRMLKIANLC